MPAGGEDPGRVPSRRSLDTCANQPRLETENAVLAAVVNTAPTDPPVTVRDWPDPTLRAGWVMVRVIRAALNRLDAMTLAERHTLARPAVIGSDAAGVVTAIGAHASAVDQGPSRRHAGQAGASAAHDDGDAGYGGMCRCRRAVARDRDILIGRQCERRLVTRSARQELPATQRTPLPETGMLHDITRQ